MNSIFALLIMASLRMSLPLLFATTGGYFSERSGVAQIALESFLLVGAFTAACTAYFTHSIVLSFLAAGVISVLFAQIFCYLVLKLKANSVVIGTALNLLAIGIIPILSKSLFNSTGSTPALDFIAQDSLHIWIPWIILVTTLIASWWLSEKSIWGLQMKFAGEKKLALESIGVSVITRQWQAISLCAFITALGGAVLSTYLSSAYSPLMSAGRGYMALAAIIFSGWNLPKALVVSLFFGFCDALQIQIQSQAWISDLIPTSFIQMLPYISTLIVLLIFKSKNQAPAELK